MKKEKPKEYEIDSLEKLLNVITKENAGRLVVDVAKWLLTYTDIMERLKAKHPEYKDKPNSEICKGSFVWIDDGKNDIIRSEIKNAATGEITYHDYKRKGKK